MDNILWHYCPPQAFISIIKSQSLWASDVKNMNDPNEVILGLDAVRKRFNQMAPGNEAWFDKFIMGPNSNDTLILAASFTEAIDDLPQWDRYAKFGTGFAIAFDRFKLSEFIARKSVRIRGRRPLGQRYIPSANLRFVKMNYDKPMMVSEADCCIRSYVENVVPYQHSFSLTPDLLSSDPLVINQAISDLGCADRLNQIVNSYKDAFYKSEMELRGFIVKRQSDPLWDIKQRDSDYGPTNYTDLPIRIDDEHAILKVMLGPKCEMTQEEVCELLNRGGYKLGLNCVLRSNGAYR